MKSNIIAVILGVVAIVIAILPYFGVGAAFAGTTAGYENAVQGFRVNGTEVISSSRGVSATTGSFSSTLGVTGTTTDTGNLVIGSSSPMSAPESGTLILANPGSGGTTTLSLSSGFGTKGGCIQIEGPASTTFRAYATTTGPLILESGTCR